MPQPNIPEIVAFDREGALLSCAAKTVAGDGLKTLQRWLDGGTADALFLHNGKGEPLVLVRLSTWHRVAKTVAKGGADGGHGPEMAETHRSVTRSSMNWSR
jgi:hypothetical protein